jgi:hypothetical protein
LRARPWRQRVQLACISAAERDLFKLSVGSTVERDHIGPSVSVMSAVGAIFEGAKLVSDRVALRHY